VTHLQHQKQSTR